MKNKEKHILREGYKMRRTLEYLKRRFGISNEEAQCILFTVRYLDQMDNGENMLYCQGVIRMPDRDENKFAEVWNLYQSMIMWDSGDLKRKAIKSIYGKDVKDLNFKL